METEDSLPDEAELVNNHRLDHLYNTPFRNGAGKYFTVVSSDPLDPTEVEGDETPYPVQNKIKTRLTFIKSSDGGYIKEVQLKRFKYYSKKGFLPQESEISFSFPFFVGLIGFLQSLAKLNLNDITERRIPLHDSPNLDEQTRRQFYTLASTENGQELIREVVKSGHLSGADIVNVAYRKAQLELFERLLNHPDAIDTYRREQKIKAAGAEPVWQHFFEKNTWIFGYGLNFVFNKPLEGDRLERIVRGGDIAGPGKRTDALLRTSGALSTLCLVEIKTPDDKLLEREPYRPGCWQPSKPLSGGIAQIQKTVQVTIQNLGAEFRPTQKDGMPTGEVLYAYRPKSFLIIGKLSEFVTDHGPNREKFSSFELLRRHTLEPEIITFDELLERATFIVSNS